MGLVQVALLTAPVVGLAIGAFVALGATARAQSAAVVGPWPGVTQMGVGEDAAITIRIQDVGAMYGADVRLAFDQTLLEVVDAEPAVPGTQLELLDEFLLPEFILANAADNVNGTAWYAATQMNPTLPVTGTGDVARITFRGLKEGSSGVTVTYQKLARRNGVPIGASTVEAIINIGAGGPTRTPPPTSTRTPFPTTTPPPTASPTETGPGTGTVPATGTSGATVTATGTGEPSPTSGPDDTGIFLPYVVGG